MTPERRARIESVLEEMQQDLHDDIAWLEGKPFDGPIVAEAFGRLGGTVAALAGVVLAVVKEEGDLP
jgi:hypothetical protein